MDVFGINRVQLAYPVDLQHEVRHFYGELLGLTLMPPTPGPVLRYGARGQRVDLVATHPLPERPPGWTQLSFEVQGLPQLRQRLLDAALVLEEHLALPGYLRFFVHDPAGNRLEFIEPDTA